MGVSDQLHDSVVAFVLMLAAAALSTAMTPTHRLSLDRPINIKFEVPERFGDWVGGSNSADFVVNPQQTAILNKIYSQILTRTYLNVKTGQHVMLSIAYGEDERDGTQLHYPEVCYPAQGFQVRSIRKSRVVTLWGSIPVYRLETVRNDVRYEPVTYWTMIADQAVLGGVKKKLVEMSFGLNGKIVDGLLFRVSSLDRDSEHAFALQEKFVDQLLTAMNPASRRRFAGVG